MLKSAESLERLSIPTPEGEGIFTKDANKLLLTAHARNRIEGLIKRAEKSAKGPFKANPIDILKTAYEQGLDEGGPGGGATVRAAIQLARDWGLDVNAIVDAHRKPHHHGALQDAQTALMQANMVGTTVNKPPFPHPQKESSKAIGVYRNEAMLTPHSRTALAKNFGSNRRPSWNWGWLRFRWCLGCGKGGAVSIKSRLRTLEGRDSPGCYQCRNTPPTIHAYYPGEKKPEPELCPRCGRSLGVIFRVVYEEEGGRT
jgi:hypothetical protein